MFMSGHLQNYASNTYYLFLDDYRMPYECLFYMYDGRYADSNWLIARTYYQFVKIIKQRWECGCFPMLVSFDHDLCEEHYQHSSISNITEYEDIAKNFKSPTGYNVAMWFVEFCKKNTIDLPECLIHSINPIGIERMKLVLGL